MRDVHECYSGDVMKDHLPEVFLLRSTQEINEVKDKVAHGEHVDFSEVERLLPCGKAFRPMLEMALIIPKRKPSLFSHVEKSKNESRNYE
jgi:hypothetical protein